MNERFRCGAPPCERGFAAPGSVTRHRMHCPHYQQKLDSQSHQFNLKRALTSDEVSIAKKTQLEKDTDEPAPTSTPVEDPSTENNSESLPLPVTNDPTLPTSIQTTTSLPANLNQVASFEPRGLSLLSGSTSSHTQDVEMQHVGGTDVLSGRPAQSRRLPVRFRDVLPEPPVPVPEPTSSPTPPPTTTATLGLALPRVILHVFDSLRTSFNAFGIGREYHHRPSYDPDAFLTVDQLSNINDHSVDSASGSAKPATFALKLPPWPFKNMSIWRLMMWKMTGSEQKSEAEVTRLVDEVLMAKDFVIKDIRGFNTHTEVKHFDASEGTLGDKDIFREDHWVESVVDILVPTRERNYTGNGQIFSVPGFFHRSLTAVIRAVFSEEAAKWFHFTPFKCIWHSPITGQEQCLYDELYTSDAWNKAHDELQKQRRDPDDPFERIIAGLMFWSDATHLAQFGHSSAWPVYMFFGNQSKYNRASPGVGACHPIAFIPLSIHEFIAQFTTKKNYSDILTHCKRELFHALWSIILDDEFVEAYRNGIVVKCYDGICRRVFPRIFTYSADYPEKVLLATIRDKGDCPCPHCLLPKSQFHRLGLLSDISARLTKVHRYLQTQITAARDAIYKLGAPIKGADPEQNLKQCSAFENSFVDRLGHLGFEIFPVLVVDLLHEFELGVFKSVFKHLLRILHATGPEPLIILNKRFCMIPSFGKGAIRRFPSNVSDIKQRAARHFEDVLQCAIPAFEGLFPPGHDNIIRVLLFWLAEWHALAKLRLHSDDSLDLLDEATKSLGKQLRKFQEYTCSKFKTTELPAEAAAWRRRSEGRMQSETQAASNAGVRLKYFNLLTYKLHALRDYVNMIRTFGTTDSYTTQVGELAHQLIKTFYQSTNKQEPAKQLARQERRHTRVRRQLDRVNTAVGLKQKSSENMPPVAHHNLSDSSTNAVNLAKFLSDRPDDPALKDFVPKLKNHLLSRLLNLDYDGDEHIFTDDQRCQVRFVDGLNRVLRPKRFQINYTTYNADIMMLSGERGPDTHPFWYAHVLGAFHIDVEYIGTNPCTKRTMDFLWVRWFGVVPGYCWGLKQARLPKIGFIPNSSSTFGFLDPSLVLRACHLIPAFADGHTDSLQSGPSTARAADEVNDWSSYYVNIFADRDMFAHFTGIGVGHAVQSPLSMDDQDSESSRDGDASEPETDPADNVNKDIDTVPQVVGLGGDFPPQSSKSDSIDVVNESNEKDGYSDKGGKSDDDGGSEDGMESDSEELESFDSDDESESKGPDFEF
ncbi:hypothetical protein BDN67DRAFT_1015721 [Paxillus ammoniavirescens]|nr:hypothetical protein BDN67DRAFT_1015721 [Paxillus ammoniavirescens]